MIRTALAFAIVLVITSAAPAQSPWLPEPEQAKLRELWPAGVELPAGLKFYKRAEWSQSLSITDNVDTLLPYHESKDDYYANTMRTDVNPNRLFPWRFSGGLHEAKGWKSSVAIALPKGAKISVWRERVEAGARHKLPKQSWSFPVGTIAVDILSVRDQVFEVRTREKTADGWEPAVAFRGEVRPLGYNGRPGRSCASCHDKAGAQEGYGTRIRGNDTVFSAPILVPGSLEFDREHWPIKDGKP